MRRKAIFVFMLILITLALSGCGSKPNCILTIHTVHDWHGEYTRKYKVYDGYEICGFFGWNVDDGKKEHVNTVAKIVNITPEFVTLEFSDNWKEHIGLRDNYVTLEYGKEMSEGLSDETTDGGPNYYYTISFSDYSED